MNIEKYGIELEHISRRDSAPSDSEDGPSNSGEEQSSPLAMRRREYTLYSPDEDRKILRKLDRRVVFFIAGLYLLSFLDRSNIGNARIAGLDRDLGLTSREYEWLLTIFYISYITFEWMTLLFRLIPPHIYISVVVMCWGIIASAQALTTGFTQMLLLRFLLGVSEAAFCGVPFYLSFFFKREELAKRIGYFIAAAPLATTFASSLAWLITGLGQRTGLESYIAPWRLLFIVEGFPSCLVAVLVWYNLPDSPSSARFLSRREKEVAKLRLEGEQADSHHSHRINVRDILITLRDPKCYLTAFMFFSLNVAFSSTPVFLPTILNSMGFSALTSQILTAPPYLLSFASILITSKLSDRSASRSPYLLFHSALGTSGYLFILVTGLLGVPNGIRYLGIYPACIGFFSCVTLIITWTLNNQSSDSGKGTGVTILQMIGQCGPLLGTRVFPKSDGPLYSTGMLVCTISMSMVGVLTLVLRAVLQRENGKIRQRTGASRIETEQLMSEDRDRKEEHVFLYML